MAGRDYLIIQPMWAIVDLMIISEFCKSSEFQIINKETEMTEIKYTFDDDNFGSNLVIEWGNGEAWWEGHDFLARVIAAIARKLSEEVQTIPGSIYEDAKSAIGTTTNEELALKNWKEILEKIAIGFESLQQPDFDENESLQSVYDEGFTLFRKWFGHLWD